MLSMDEMMAEIPKQKWRIGPVTISKDSPWPKEAIKKVAEQLGCKVLVALHVWGEEEDDHFYQDYLVFDVTVDIGDKCIGTYAAILLEEYQRNKGKLKPLIDAKLEGAKVDAIVFADDHGLFNKGKPNGT